MSKNKLIRVMFMLLLLFGLISCETKSDLDNNNNDIIIDRVDQKIKNFFENIGNVESNLNLPIRFEEENIRVHWESDKEAVISSDGIVNRYKDDIEVELSATFILDNEIISTKTYLTTVVKLEEIIEETEIISFDLAKVYEYLEYNKNKLDTSGNFISNEFYYVSGIVVAYDNKDKRLVLNSKDDYLIIENFTDKLEIGKSMKVSIKIGYKENSPRGFYIKEESEIINAQELLETSKMFVVKTVDEYINNDINNTKSNVIKIQIDGMFLENSITNLDGTYSFNIEHLELPLVIDEPLDNQPIRITGYAMYDVISETWKIFNQGSKVEIVDPFCPIC